MLEAAIRSLQENTELPFEQARAMPCEVYTCPAFAELELEHIFAKDWFCVGRDDGLSQVGDYTTATLAGRPVAVLRDKSGRLRAFSNVCLHRMSTLLEGSGNTRSIVCPYHAWTYDLDGSLRGAPAMMHNRDFDKSEYCLPEIRCENWQGWVMITLNPDAPPVAQHLQEVADLVAKFDMSSYKQTFCERHRWNTNWKVLAENFMESYHLPVCHAETIGGLVSLDKMTCPPGRPSFNYHWILKKDGLALTLAHPDNTTLVGDERRMTYLLALYPSLMITLTPGYFWYLSLHPHGPDQVDILYGGGLSADFARDPNAQQHFEQVKDLLDAVNEEDRGCTEAVYRGLSSGLARPGHLSHLERPNYEFAQYINACIQQGQTDQGQTKRAPLAPEYARD